MESNFLSTTVNALDQGIMTASYFSDRILYNTTRTTDHKKQLLVISALALVALGTISSTFLLINISDSLIRAVLVYSKGSQSIPLVNPTFIRYHKVAFLTLSKLSIKGFLAVTALQVLALPHQAKMRRELSEAPYPPEPEKTSEDSLLNPLKKEIRDLLDQEVQENFINTINQILIKLQSHCNYRSNPAHFEARLQNILEYARDDVSYREFFLSSLDAWGSSCSDHAYYVILRLELSLEIRKSSSLDKALYFLKKHHSLAYLQQQGSLCVARYLERNPNENTDFLEEILFFQVEGGRFLSYYGQENHRQYGVLIADSTKVKEAVQQLLKLQKDPFYLFCLILDPAFGFKDQILPLLEKQFAGEELETLNKAVENAIEEFDDPKAMLDAQKAKEVFLEKKLADHLRETHIEKIIPTTLGPPLEIQEIFIYWLKLSQLPSSNQLTPLECFRSDPGGLQNYLFDLLVRSPSPADTLDNLIQRASVLIGYQSNQAKVQEKAESLRPLLADLFALKDRYEAASNPL